MDTRQTKRVDVNLTVMSEVELKGEQQLTLASGNCFKATAYDISKRGIGLHVNTFLPKGLLLKLQLPGKIFDLEKDMKIEGEIAHCRFIRQHEYRCGIKFLKISDEAKSALDKFISTHDKRKDKRINLQ